MDTDLLDGPDPEALSTDHVEVFRLD
jgi:hypothetical protein